MTDRDLGRLKMFFSEADLEVMRQNPDDPKLTWAVLRVLFRHRRHHMTSANGSFIRARASRELAEDEYRRWLAQRRSVKALPLLVYIETARQTGDIQ